VVSRGSGDGSEGLKRGQNFAQNGVKILTKFGSETGSKRGKILGSETGSKFCSKRGQNFAKIWVRNEVKF